MSLAKDLTFDALALDPYPLLAELRRDSPVVFAPNLGMWLITRYDHTTAVLRDPQTFSNDSPASTIQQTFGRQMLSVEGEEQKRFKRAALAPFTFTAARDVWRPQLEERCQALLAPAKNEPRIELMSTLSRPIALETMGLVLGLESRDLPTIRSWYECFAAALANFEGDQEIFERGQTAAAEMRSHLTDRLEDAARRSEEATLTSRLAAIEGQSLDRTEILANLMIVLFGGIETTESMIGNALWWLFRTSQEGDPHLERLIESLASDPNDLSLLDRIIEESLRYEPAVQSLTRHATVDATVAGQAIEQGDTVQCMIGGANRDPEVFADPERFDIERPNNREHLSFGLGTHFCLGAQLARMETRCALSVLFRSFPDLAFQADASSPPHGHEFRKPASLWARTQSTA